MRSRIQLMTTGLVALALAACAPAPLAPQTEEPVATTNVRVETASPTPTEETGPTPAGPPACQDIATDLPLEVRVGQLYMVGVSTAGLDTATAAAISDSKVGSVVLLGNTSVGAGAIGELSRAVTDLGDPDLPIVVAVDQEGGTVQRLKGTGFSDIPPATEQAQLAEFELRDLANGWANELRTAGVDFNLAPVADVVPEAKQNTNAPIGRLQRNYGNDPQAASDAVSEFVAGMTNAGVATSLKHFPGLGQVVENTDFAVAIDTDVVPGDEDWAPFMAGIDAGAQSVMISSGIFENIDPGVQAVFSHRIVTQILREELGFEGIAIADDLGAAGAVADIPPADRGVRFIEAGGDIVINADPALLAEMVAATTARAEGDPAFDQQVTDAAARVLQLKAWLNLVDCA